MIRTCLTLVVLMMVSVLMMGSSFKEKSEPVAAVQAPPVKKSCTGFTVIEASKGINCYGDTVRLVKRAGVYQLASAVAMRDAQASL